MQTFTIKADDSFKFVSSWAADPSEIFIAFKDRYETGYICIDSKGNSFILKTQSVEDNLSQGIYKIVPEISESIN